MSEEEAHRLVDDEASKLKINWIKDSVMLTYPEQAGYVGAQLRHLGRLVVRVDKIGTRVITYDVDIRKQELIKFGMQLFVRGLIKGREEYKK